MTVKVALRLVSRRVRRDLRALRARLRRIGVRALAALPVLAFGSYLLADALPPIAFDLLLAAARGTAWAGVLAIVGSVVLWAWDQSERVGEVRVEDGARLEDDVLVLPGRGARKEHRVPLSELESGWVWESWPTSAGTRLASGGRAVVELFTREGDVWVVRVPSVDEGVELLAACGVDAKRRKIRFERRSPGSFIGSFLASVAITSFAAPIYAGAAIAIDSRLALVTIPAIFVATWAALIRLMALGPIEVGADGVAWTERSWRGPRRFVPWRAMLDTRIDENELVLETTSGETRVPLGPIELRYSRMLAHRIADARSREADAESLAVFEPSGRPFAVWIDDLKTWGDASDYRRAAIPKVRVIETLEDPDAPPGRRVGAALALALDDDEDTRALGRHLARDLAASAADATLVDALEAVAEDRLDAPALARLAEPD